LKAQPTPKQEAKKDDTPKVTIYGETPITRVPLNLGLKAFKRQHRQGGVNKNAKKQRMRKGIEEFKAAAWAKVPKLRVPVGAKGKPHTTGNPYVRTR
jgi:hypothetical protein